MKAIAEGTVTVAFRRWRRPTVRPGGTLVTAIGVLAIDSIEETRLNAITLRDARASGHGSVADLKTELAKQREGSLYRIAFHVQGADPRIALRSRIRLSADEVVDPGVRAPSLAEEIGVETVRFKTNVRKLKSVGLTESLKVGYRLSPRGEAVLRLLK